MIALLMGEVLWMDFNTGGALLVILMFSYVIMMLAFTHGVFRGNLSRLKKRSGRMDVVPLVSVLVAVRNEESNLDNLLNGLLIQNFPAGFWEVVISDDHSEDHTVAILKKFKDANPEFPLKIITAELRTDQATGKKVALDRAIGDSKGSVLLCTDGDTTMGPRWISAMVSALDDPEVMMALGPVFVRRGGSLLQKLQELEFFGIMGLTAGSASLGMPVMANGANLCFRRDVYTLAGGYQRHQHFASGDDQFLMMLVKKQFGPGSIRFNFNHDGVIFTPAEPKLKGFFNQRLRWVSKSTGYRDGWVLLTGLVAGFTTLSLFVGVVWSVVISSPDFFIMVLALWLVKVLSDLPMVLKMRNMSGSNVWLVYYIPAQLFQLVYIPVIAAASFFVRSRWKGRRI